MIQMQYYNPPVKHYTALSFTTSEVNILAPRPAHYIPCRVFRGADVLLAGWWLLFARLLS